MNKATVTNASVSEPEENQVNPSGEGEIPLKEKELEKRVREQLRAEESRKSSELSEKLEEVTSRYEELNEKHNLTQKELEEFRKLKSSKRNIEAELYELENNPEYEAYRVKIEREGKRAEDAAYKKMSTSLADEFIEDKAEELGIDSKKFAKELLAICADGRYGKLDPHRFVKKAFQDWSKKKSSEEKLEADRKKKEQDDIHQEGGRKKEFNSLDQIKKEGSFIDALKATGQL